MSDIKYSIDDILREAAKIKAGGTFVPTGQEPPAPQALPQKEAPQPLSQAERLPVIQKPQTVRAVRRTVTGRTRQESPESAVQTQHPPKRQAPPPLSPPENYGNAPREDYAARIAREILASNSHSKTQELPAAAIRQNGAGSQLRSRTVPLYIPPEQTASPVAVPVLTEKELLEEIQSQKSRYRERKERAEPRADYNPKYNVSPHFTTPDANRQEKTLIIDAQQLRNIAAAPAKEPMAFPAYQRTAQTQVIDPRELKSKPDFRFIRESGTVHTAPPSPAAAQPKPVQPIASRRDYAQEFPNASAPSQASIPVQKGGRDRFIRGSIIRKSERTDEILFAKTPPVIERPAVIRGQTRFQKTGDLQSIPELMSVEAFQTKASDSPTAPMPKLEEFDYTAQQLRLDGFEPEHTNPDNVDEWEAEEQLLERRSEKVNHFRLFSAHKENDVPEDYYEFGAEEDEPYLEPITDYISPKDKESVLENLAAKARKLTFRTAVTGGLTVLMLFFSILEAMGILPVILSDTYTLLTLFSAVTLIVFIFNINTLLNGLKGLLRFKPDADFPVTMAAAFVLAQTVYAYISPDLITEGLPLYSMALCFGFLCNNLGKQAMLRRVHANFEFLTAPGEHYTVQDIYDQKDTQAICHGLLMGDPVVKHGVKTDFPTNFLEIAYKQEPADRLSKKIAPFTLLISIAIGVGAYFLNKSVSLAISAATCAACISVPVVNLLASNTALLSMSKKIKSNGAMVNGFHGAEQMKDANAIIFDAADLFPGGSCDLHGIKTFGGMRVDDAILQTAAVVISTKGPLQDVFDKVIVGKQSILPEVDTLVYEERMGTSCWIYGKKVLVGNRQLLLSHGVKAPPEEFEAKYRHNGRYPLYLTIAGKIAAMFVVSYQANARVKEELLRLEKSGMTVLVRTADPNIDEEMLTGQYDLAEGFVRVLSSASGRIYEKYSERSVPAYPAYIVHNGTANGFISAMYASDVLSGVKNLLSIVQIFGIILGLGLAAVFAISGSLSQIGALRVVLFQAVWSVLVLLFSRYKK